MFLGRRHPKDARTNINVHIEMDSRTLGPSSNESEHCLRCLLWPRQWQVLSRSVAINASEPSSPLEDVTAGHLVAGRFYWEVWKYQLYLVDVIYEDGTLALAGHMLKPKQPLQSIRCQLVSNLCYLIPVHVLVPLPQGQYMESQLGLALVGPTSCTSCLCRKKNPSTFSGSGVKLSSAVQISAPTNVQSNMRTLSYRRSPRSQLFSQTNLNAFERIMGEVCISVHLELPRSLHDHYLSFLESEAGFPFLILSRLSSFVRVMSHFCCWIHNLVPVIALLFNAAVGIEFVSQRLHPNHMVEMLPDILKNLWTNKDKKSARKKWSKNDSPNYNLMKIHEKPV